MSESNYIGFGAFILGLTAGIFMATVDPLKVLSEILIYTLKMTWNTLNQLYPGTYPPSMYLMFTVVIILLATLPTFAFFSDLLKVLSYGIINLAAFVSGIFAGLFIFSNQGLAIFFAMQY